MRILISIMLCIHGLIHLIGFFTGFQLKNAQPFHHDIGKLQGLMWLGVCILFVVTAVLYLTQRNTWWLFLILAVIISQVLLFVNWQDAKFGSVFNLIFLLLAVVALFQKKFEHVYELEVKNYLSQSKSDHTNLLTLKDIENLPEPVKKYIAYTGSLNKPKIENFKVLFEGRIRKNEKSEWMLFNSEQHNFLSSSARLFFMKAVMKHLPVAGFHCYINGNAFMDIRLLSLFRVQYQSAMEMGTAETVTFFNDMCVMAPATLIDPGISWKLIDEKTVEAKFTRNKITITALLYFNENCQLINFTSEDRYALNDQGIMQKFRWSTPMKEYKEFKGYTLASYAETIYKYPEGDFCYGTFRMTDWDYNLKEE